jgi:hypothetical protein
MKNRVTEILGSEYPIIQGAMRRISLGTWPLPCPAPVASELSGHRDGRQRPGEIRKGRSSPIGLSA